MTKYFTINDIRVLTHNQVLEILNQLIEENEQLRKENKRLKELVEYFADELKIDLGELEE